VKRVNDERYTLTQIANVSGISKRTLERYRDLGIISNEKEMSATGMTTMVPLDDIREAVKKYNTGKIGKDRLDPELIIQKLRALDGQVFEDSDVNYQILDATASEEIEQLKDQIFELQEERNKLKEEKEQANSLFQQATIKFTQLEEERKTNQLMLDTTKEEKERLLKEKETIESELKRVREEKERIEKEKEVAEKKTEAHKNFLDALDKYQEEKAQYDKKWFKAIRKIEAPKKPKLEDYLK
jgi:chromosome segregation ATPase